MSRPSEPRRPAFLTLRGRATSPGLACGPLRRNDPALEPADAAESILVAERAVPDDVGRILAAAGTLTLGGALLSHVSLLSREFGKPSVALGRHGPARLLPPSGAGVLQLDEPGGGDAPLVLREGDVVMLDGDRGELLVPGGADAGARSGIREAHHHLVRYGGGDGEDAALTSLAAACAGADGEVVAYVLEAALVYRRVPAGDAARRLLRAVDGAAPERAAETCRRLARRIAEQARDRGAAARKALRTTDDLDELRRVVGDFEQATDAARAVLDDLGADGGALDRDADRLREGAHRRRTELATRLGTEIDEALGLSEEALEDRVGMLHQLLRRARLSQLDAERIDALRARLSRIVTRERARAGEHLVVPLDNGPQDRGLVGGKAAGMFRIAGILPQGVRMPRGFVVTTTAYRLHLLGETGERLRRAAAETDVAAMARRARAALLSGEVPEEVSAAILPLAAELGDVRLAVRSSSTVEDGPSGTLAGLFDTYLGVRGADELIKKIRWAWSSQWNLRALSAMSAAGISPLSASQAVIVQEIVETRAAGVLFSRDPGGQPDTILVNAAWGLGEGVSQGEVAGDVYRVRRSTGELLDRETAAEGTQILLDPGGVGTVEVELPRQRAGTPCLDERDLERLAELAQALQVATGRSQDVEFGFAPDGTLVVFQVRRIVPRAT